jgi:preprotein translocase subunit YajC
VEVLIPIVILFGLFWFFVMLPQRRRASDHRSMQDAIAPGDEIITAGGLHGEVVEFDEAVLHVEIAPGTVVRIDRRAGAARVEPETDDGGVGQLPVAEHHDDVSS